MNRRTKKKRDKQLLGELWQHQNEPWVKHWSVAFKHSRKYYEWERRRFFECRNLMDIRIADRVLRGPVICISKKDIIDKEGILKPLWQGTYDG